MACDAVASCSRQLCRMTPDALVPAVPFLETLCVRWLLHDAWQLAIGQQRLQLGGRVESEENASSTHAGSYSCEAEPVRAVIARIKEHIAAAQRRQQQQQMDGYWVEGKQEEREERNGLSDARFFLVGAGGEAESGEWQHVVAAAVAGEVGAAVIEVGRCPPALLALQSAAPRSC
ncbi:unnamed protein product [Closterium sp. Naga37s-1]|nr:unnamed protein product [Closterium sp. Naga37s-1]